MNTTRTTSAFALALACASASAAAAPLRDPFARPAAPVNVHATAAESAAATPEPALELRAVMYDPGHSMANVSGRILSVGDSYGPYRVVRIDERNVTLLRNKVKSVLVLDKESGK
jgi:hypothetical protein